MSNIFCCSIDTTSICIDSQIVQSIGLMWVFKARLVIPTEDEISRMDNYDIFAFLITYPCSVAMPSGCLFCWFPLQSNLLCNAPAEK